MNIWIEYWEKSKEPSKNTHAQMRENVKWVEPDPKIISRRYFSTMAAATEFAKIIKKGGQMIRIKQDSGG